MKKSLLILSIASFAIISSTHAQIKKGATLIGGNIGGGTSNTDNPNSPYVDQSSLAVGLRFGKAVKENLIVGGIVSYSGNKWENSNISPTSSTQRQYSAGVFARKYKPIGNSGFYIFGTGSLAGVLTRYTDTYPQPGSDTKTKGTAVNLSVDPGVSYAVNKWLQIEAGLNNLLTLSYQVSTREDMGGSYKTKSFNGNVNVSGQVPLYLGLTVLLN
ncbi:porin family protein [Terrimonas sp. NA20]|uniref:Porin family protein n=1 Tax=Terrimonas ginsenosidimutans TaxID=2908004 RepID=A0ABS9KQ78_9BACT|nr:outer membrane beta-barrel protein [Terrimonas ginsenosidimutans]MCG2614483.1 porin family protein [Terrimonas ginsenosidimutans]